MTSFYVWARRSRLRMPREYGLRRLPLRAFLQEQAGGQAKRCRCVGTTSTFHEGQRNFAIRKLAFPFVHYHKSLATYWWQGRGWTFWLSPPHVEAKVLFCRVLKSFSRKL